jgi:hypothetical protein
VVVKIRGPCGLSVTCQAYLGVLWALWSGWRLPWRSRKQLPTRRHARRDWSASTGYGSGLPTPGARGQENRQSGLSDGKEASGATRCVASDSCLVRTFGVCEVRTCLGVEHDATHPHYVRAVHLIRALRIPVRAKKGLADRLVESCRSRQLIRLRTAARVGTRSRRHWRPA